MSSLSQTFSYDFENEAMMAKFRWLAQPEGQDHGWSQQIRLTSWTSNGTTLNQTQSWNLSLEGAWNSTTVNGNTETRTFNQTYETLFSNANPMSHDRKGNLTQNKDGSLYTWDFDNQLSYSTAGTPSVNAAYAYDALGRRVSKSSGNTITVFVHTHYQIATEYKSINGGAFTENQSFVYATYIDDPIALISTNGTYFYHSNQQFSIAAITDSNGNLSERYGYNAYGKPVLITDSILVDNPYFFTGRQLDAETGLFYFRARYYDASLGQFISRDPLNYVDGMNLYRGYFAVTDLDPSGAIATLDQVCPITILTNHKNAISALIGIVQQANVNVSFGGLANLSFNSKWLISHVVCSMTRTINDCHNPFFVPGCRQRYKCEVDCVVTIIIASSGSANANVPNNPNLSIAGSGLNSSGQQENANNNGNQANQVKNISSLVANAGFSSYSTVTKSNKNVVTNTRTCDCCDKGKGAANDTVQ